MTTAPATDEAPRNLTDRLTNRGPDTDADELFDIFLEWTIDRGFELYPAQEEAILEVFAGNHVVLNTPTGSGKSLVALAMHFYSFARGERSYYTSPIKALVNEKFFDLCQHFGAENVGMSTGDASINQDAPIVCCTQEILAAAALSEGETAAIHHAVIDEFHYYGDRERGVAWQLPLLLLPQTAFLLMTATLGDPEKIAKRLKKRTGREVALVKSTERPVPLEFRWATDILVNTIEELVGDGLAPVYVVNFTQRDCAELAQALMSLKLTPSKDKDAIKEILKEATFDTPYGSVMKRYLQHGVAVHHGGLLPKYRRIVERLAQMGLLRVISGTDTLGVGINLPLRTVLFTQLYKYDGEKTRQLKVRDFKQIAGRAGRKGYDDRGLVVCQAPEYVIENMRIDAKIAANPAKAKKLKKKSAPDKRFVDWDEETFQRLASSESERLKSRFTVTHAMLLELMQRPRAAGCGYRALIDLIALSHSRSGEKSRLRRKARMLFQSLRAGGIIELEPRTDGKRGQRTVLQADLQHDFSIHHALSLYLVEAAGRLNPEDPEYHLKLLSLVEAILEDPRVVLFQQMYKARNIAYAQMKADGVEYEERQEKLEEITWPMPDVELIAETFGEFAQRNPWVGSFEPAPKSVVRDMYERYCTFNEYVNEFGLERSEGVLLRHISQTYKTLKQNVPENLRTEMVYDVIAYIREVIARADSSLVQEWEMMRYGPDGVTVEDGPPPPLDADPKAFKARVRAELRAIVQALAADELEEVPGLLRRGEKGWTPMGLEAAFEDYYAEYDRIVFDHAARATSLIRIQRTGPGYWEVTQALCDPQGDNMWFLRGNVDVNAVPDDPDARLFALEEIGR